MTRLRPPPPVVWALALALAAAAVAGCGPHGAKGKGNPVDAGTATPAQTKLRRNVTLAAVKQERLPSFVETVGVLEAESQTDLAAGVPGVIDEVLFREGQLVDPTTVLVKIDQPRYRVALDLARANEAKAGEVHQLNLRLEDIARGGGTATSREDLTRLIYNARTSANELASAKAARERAEHELRLSQVRPRYAGQINQRRVTPGAFVKEDTVIATLADLRKLRLVGYIPERAEPQVRQMLDASRPAPPVPAAVGLLGAPADAAAREARHDRPGYEVQFTLRAFPDREFTARVFYLSTVASADTHLFECKAEVEQTPDGALKPGFTAKIRVPVPGRPTSLVVPEEAVRATERGNIAYRPRPERDKAGRPVTDKEGKLSWVAEAVTLDLGMRGKGWVEVVSGLAPGDHVVQAGAASVEDNTPIRFSPEMEKALLKGKE